MAGKPFVLARFDWSTGSLVLRFIKKAPWGGPVWGEYTTDPRQACRWASRQAAHQYLRRFKSYTGWSFEPVAKRPKPKMWHVVDLRRIGWKD